MKDQAPYVTTWLAFFFCLWVVRPSLRRFRRYRDEVIRYRNEQEVVTAEEWDREDVVTVLKREAMTDDVSTPGTSNRVSGPKHTKQARIDRMKSEFSASWTDKPATSRYADIILGRSVPVVVLS